MADFESILRVDTPEVRVTEVRLEPGASTGRHRHNYDCVVVPLTAGTLRLVAAEGESAVVLSPGAAYYRKAGVEHTVFNAGGAPLAFIDVELKGRPG
ncbi:MAG TPA: cupin domain-containing protein [Stellaceae bacterium]|nr:cupin domain-containing protein [Stellaceae bacterium]